MSEGKQWKLDVAMRTALKIADELKDWCTQIGIAGSIRRGRPFVGDIDIVLEPKSELDHKLILTRCEVTARYVKGGSQYQVFELPGGLQLDLWFAHAGQPEERDMLQSVTRAAKPGNFGMLMLTRTGSYQHNIYLAQVAKSRGLHFAAHDGIQQAGRVIASESEDDVFRALGMDYLAPERRER